MFYQWISLTSSKFSYNNVCLTVTGLMVLSMQTLKNLEWNEFSLRNYVYNAKLSLETRLQLGFAIEYTHF